MTHPAKLTTAERLKVADQLRRIAETMPAEEAAVLALASDCIYFQEAKLTQVRAALG